jgi:lysozyme family protein
MTPFGTAFAYILQREGGYVNDPRDNGGMTNLGVTWRTWQDWTGKPATEAVMRSLTPAKVAPLYKARYWDPIRGDDLPGPVALCLFDFGINASPARAAKLLQGCVGAAKDGRIGPATLIAVRNFIAAHGVAELVRQFTEARRVYYHACDDFPHFGKGWLRRCDITETEALRGCP